jgi:hypothetical protein
MRISKKSSGGRSPGGPKEMVNVNSARPILESQLALVLLKRLSKSTPQITAVVSKKWKIVQMTSGAGSLGRIMDGHPCGLGSINLQLKGFLTRLSR